MSYMARTTARITSKSQLVLPKAVRELLDVGPGDLIVFEYGPEGVRIEKVRNDEDPFGAFDEWASAADDEAYRSL